MKNKIILFIVSFILLHCSPSFSQKNDSSIDSTVVEQDVTNGTDEKYIIDTTLSKNKFTKEDDSIRAYKMSKDFAYIIYLDSMLRLNKDLKMDTVSSNDINKKKNNKTKKAAIKPVGESVISNPFIRVVLWMLAIFFIGFIIFKLFLSEGFFKTRTAQQKTAEADEQQETMLQESGYEPLIRQALANKNFRLAIRYLYLQTLQKLTATGAIQFAVDKTNYEYVREIANRPYQKDFASLTLNYEYVWYGRFDINEDVYQRLQKDFRSFQQKVY